MIIRLMKSILRSQFLILLTSLVILLTGCTDLSDNSVEEYSSVHLTYSVKYKHNDIENNIGEYSITYSFDNDNFYSISEQSNYIISTMGEAMHVKNDKMYNISSSNQLLSYHETEENNGKVLYNRNCLFEYVDDVVGVYMSEVRIDTETPTSSTNDNWDRILPSHFKISLNNINAMIIYREPINLSVGLYWFSITPYGFIEKYTCEAIENKSISQTRNVNCYKIVQSTNVATAEFWIDEANQLVEIIQIMPDDFFVIYSLESVSCILQE